MDKEKLSNVDLALLRMDVPNNLMIINSVMILETPLTMARLRDTVKRSLLSHDRFHQRVVQPALPFQRPYWEDDPNFDLSAHVIPISRPIPQKQEFLELLVSEMMSLPMDPDRPLWQFFLVERYGSGSALICRMHHSIADGIALMRVLLSMADAEPNAVHALPASQASKNGFNLQRRVKKPLRQRLAQSGAQALNDPAGALETAKLGARTMAAMGRFALRWPDPPTVFKGKLDGKKQAVWSGPFSLEEVKQIGRAFDATVNDVLLTILSGALRRYMLAHDEKVERGDIHSFVPVNLRPAEAMSKLGNRFGLVFLQMPVGIADSVERLYATKQNMDALKASSEAVATFGLMYLMGIVPRFQNFALSIFDSKGTAVTTNVPGPRQQLYLAGSPIDTIMAWVPKSGHVGLGISIISYNGKVQLGVAADRGLVPDPEKILEYFTTEFTELRARAEVRRADKPADLKSMLALLDRTVQTLDQILAGEDGGSNDKISKAPVEDQQRTANSCLATTKAGKPCKNKALEGEQFCRVHR